MNNLSNPAHDCLPNIWLETSVIEKQYFSPIFWISFNLPGQWWMLNDTDCCAICWILNDISNSKYCIINIIITTSNKIKNIYFTYDIFITFSIKIN